MSSYRYTGEYAGTVMVGENSVPVAPGDFVELSKDDLENEDNAVLIDEELLLDVKEAEKTAAEQEKAAEKEAAATAAKEDKEVKK